jgi:hypothetical protein
MEREDEIRIIAYNIWQEEGCCDGRDMDHWLRAEVIWAEQQRSKQPASSAKKKKTTLRHPKAKVTERTQKKS